MAPLVWFIALLLTTATLADDNERKDENSNNNDKWSKPLAESRFITDSLFNDWIPLKAPCPTCRPVETPGPPPKTPAGELVAAATSNQVASLLSPPSRSPAPPAPAFHNHQPLRPHRNRVRQISPHLIGRPPAGIGPFSFFGGGPPVRPPPPPPQFHRPKSAQRSPPPPPQFQQPQQIFQGQQQQHQQQQQQQQRNPISLQTQHLGSITPQPLLQQQPASQQPVHLIPQQHGPNAQPLQQLQLPFQQVQVPFQVPQILPLNQGLQNPFQYQVLPSQQPFAPASLIQFGPPQTAGVQQFQSAGNETRNFLEGQQIPTVPPGNPNEVDEQEEVQLLYVPLEALRTGAPIPQQPAQHVNQNVELPQTSTTFDSHRQALTRPVTSPPPEQLEPHQPPLSVFMGKDSRNRNREVKVTDVLNLLRGARTIPVLDTIDANVPKVFIGPTNLKAPKGFAKFELPYLSSLDSNRVERKVNRLPFFIAPLSFQPPAGYSKIPFPAPHIGSVVVSNATTEPTANKNDFHDKVVTSDKPQRARITPRPHPTEQTIIPIATTAIPPYLLPQNLPPINPSLPHLVNSLAESSAQPPSPTVTETLQRQTETSSPAGNLGQASHINQGNSPSFPNVVSFQNYLNRPSFTNKSPQFETQFQVNPKTTFEEPSPSVGSGQRGGANFESSKVENDSPSFPTSPATPPTYSQTTRTTIPTRRPSSRVRGRTRPRTSSTGDATHSTTTGRPSYRQSSATASVTPRTRSRVRRPNGARASTTTTTIAPAEETQYNVQEDFQDFNQDSSFGTRNNGATVPLKQTQRQRFQQTSKESASNFEEHRGRGQFQSSQRVNANQEQPSIQLPDAESVSRFHKQQPSTAFQQFESVSNFPSQKTTSKLRAFDSQNQESISHVQEPATEQDPYQKPTKVRFPDSKKSTQFQRQQDETPNQPSFLHQREGGRSHFQSEQEEGQFEDTPTSFQRQQFGGDFQPSYLSSPQIQAQYEEPRDISAQIQPHIQSAITETGELPVQADNSRDVSPIPNNQHTFTQDNVSPVREHSIGRFRQKNIHESSVIQETTPKSLDYVRPAYQRGGVSTYQEEVASEAQTEQPLANHPNRFRFVTKDESDHAPIDSAGLAQSGLENDSTKPDISSGQEYVIPGQDFTASRTTTTQDELERTSTEPTTTTTKTNRKYPNFVSRGRRPTRPTDSSPTTTSQPFTVRGTRRPTVRVGSIRTRVRRPPSASATTEPSNVLTTTENTSPVRSALRDDSRSRAPVPSTNQSGNRWGHRERVRNRPAGDEDSNEEGSDVTTERSSRNTVTYSARNRGTSRYRRPTSDRENSNRRHPSTRGDEQLEGQESRDRPETVDGYAFVSMNGKKVKNLEPAISTDDPLPETETDKVTENLEPSVTTEETTPHFRQSYYEYVNGQQHPSHNSEDISAPHHEWQPSPGRVNVLEVRPNYWSRGHSYHNRNEESEKLEESTDSPVEVSETTGHNAYPEEVNNKEPPQSESSDDYITLVPVDEEEPEVTKDKEAQPEISEEPEVTEVNNNEDEKESNPEEENSEKLDVPSEKDNIVNDDDEEEETSPNLDRPSPVSVRFRVGTTVDHNSKKARGGEGRRRGTWIRVRSRPRQPENGGLDTAESQNVASAAAENSVADLKTEKVRSWTLPILKDENTNNDNDQKQTEAEEEASATATDRIDTVSTGYTLLDDITHSPGSTTPTESIAAAAITSASTNHPENSSDDELAESVSTFQPLRVIGTSSTTEISLETEICYRGRCVKTKVENDPILRAISPK